MDAHSGIDGEIAILRSMIDGPDSGLDDFLAERPYLHGPDDARDDLARLVVGLEDVRAGRVASHDEILADAQARRRGGGAQAAE